MGLLFERVKAWVAARSPRQVLLFGLALFVLYGFPGFMSNDSVNQLLEARALTFSDGHPPFMAAEWSLLDRIIAGPVLMFLLQGTLFLVGARMIYERVFCERGAAWAAIGTLLFPPVLSVMAVIWKDAQMAAYLIVGIGCILQPRKRTRVAGLVLLVVAALVRHNGLVAVFPIVLLVFELREGMRLRRRLAVVGGATVVLVGLTFGVSSMLTTSHVTLTPMWSDIVGVLTFGDTRTDEELREVLRGTPLVVDEGIQAQARIIYALRGAYRITEGNERLFRLPKDPAEQAALNRAWKELVLGDPGAYLAYHWSDFKDLLGMNPQHAPGVLWNWFLEDREGQIDLIHHDATWSGFQWKASAVVYWVGIHTPFFSPWLYVVVAFLLGAVLCRDRLTAALLASGVLYELSYFPVGANPDFRYSHWLITSVTIACVMLVAQRIKARRA